MNSCQDSSSVRSPSKSAATSTRTRSSIEGCYRMQANLGYLFIARVSRGSNEFPNYFDLINSKDDSAVSKVGLARDQGQIQIDMQADISIFHHPGPNQSKHATRALPPPFNISHTPPSNPFIRFIPLPRNLKLLYLERGEAMLMDLESNTECACWPGMLCANHYYNGDQIRYGKWRMTLPRRKGSSKVETR